MHTINTKLHTLKTLAVTNSTKMFIQQFHHKMRWSIFDLSKQDNDIATLGL